MTKISQLSDIGGSLAAGDEFVIRDVSDISTPNKKVTASGFIDYVIAQGVGSGFTQISAGATAPASVRCFSSGTTREVIVTTSGVERLRVDSSGQILIGTLGTAAAPVWSFLSDPNTGIYSPAADTLAFTEGGVEAMRIDSSGRLSVGTTTATLGGNPFRFAVAGTKTYSELIPRDGFAVADNTATAQGVGGSIALLGIYDGSGNYTAFGGIEGQKENGTSGNYAGALVFKSRASFGFLNEAVRITSVGNVGIGTTSPSNQLQLSTDSAGKPSTNTWTIVSDERIKEDIELADLDLCYQAVKDIPLKRFKWKDEVYTDEQVRDRHKLGWIAQDVEAVYPKAVGTHEFKYNQVFEEITVPSVAEELDKEGNVLIPAQPERIEQGSLISEDVIDDCRDLNSDQLYAAMYGAIQKLISKVETLETEIAILKSA